MTISAMGPLAGIKVVEIAGIGPGPWAAMALSDMGADVLRIDRPDDVPRDGARPDAEMIGLNRGRRSVAVDLKAPGAADLILQLAERSDVLLEGFRPGVAERLGVGPEPCMARNPRLVYGRMTGWGQDGAWRDHAGHDLNFVATSGVLHSIGAAGGPPVPPLSLVGDFGGGGLMLAFGVVCALREAASSGQGQIVDAAMVDGSALLATLFYIMRQEGSWSDERGVNLLDGGAPFYGVYETADHRWLAVGAIEPKFYANLLAALELGDELLERQYDREDWPRAREILAAVFRTRTRDAWASLLDEAEACTTPVLNMLEAMDNEHMASRGVFTELDGVRQPAPAPRLSRTPGAIQRPPAVPGEHTDEALADWGVASSEIAALHAAGVVASVAEPGAAAPGPGIPSRSG
jgi:alpha-methylacyl-CoA racemase